MPTYRKPILIMPTEVLPTHTNVYFLHVALEDQVSMASHESAGIPSGTAVVLPWCQAADSL